MLYTNISIQNILNALSVRARGYSIEVVDKLRVSDIDFHYVKTYVWHIIQYMEAYRLFYIYMSYN